jgi:hypothetical protein
MPVIGRNRGAIALAACLLLAPAVHAQDKAGLEAHALVESMNSALLDGNGKAVAAIFDPKMTGYKTLTRDIILLTRVSTGVSTIEFPGNAGDDQSRDLDLNWHMQIRSYNGQSTTDRRARVKLHLQKQNDQWRITAFAPLDFFSPPHMGAVWDVISDALTGLTEVSGDPHPGAQQVPTRFLSAFDPKMPSYGQVRTNVIGLLDEGHIYSNVEMVRNEGDDRTREVELNWDLSLVNRNTKITIFDRSEHVTCRLERQHGKWKIVSLDPIAILAPQPPAATAPGK